jgi:hypothetical protein
LRVEQINDSPQPLDLAQAAVTLRQMKSDVGRRDQRLFAVSDRHRCETYTFATHLIHVFLSPGPSSNERQQLSQTLTGVIKPAHHRPFGYPQPFRQLTIGETIQML